MGLFGPTHSEVWQQLSAQIGAQYSGGGFLKGDRVDSQVGDWTVTLDLITEDKTEYTRLRAPFINPTGLYFSVSRADMFSQFAHSLGGQDITVGDPYFDECFVVKSNDERSIINLLQDPGIRQLFDNQPSVHLEVRKNEGFFGASFPENTSELHFLGFGVNKDLYQLKGLFDLFGAVLHGLTVSGAASEGNPGVYL